MTQWTAFLQQKVKETGKTYMCLLSDKAIQEEYKKIKVKPKKEPKLNKPKVSNEEFRKKMQDRAENWRKKEALKLYNTPLENLIFINGDRNNFGKNNIKLK